MGKRYVQHADMCGCERCARQYECDNPRPVYDEIEDPNVLDCGCNAWRGCNCAEFDLDGDE